MNKIKYIIVFLVSVGLFSSCELDNLEGPTADLYGSIIDDVTGDLVEQDIIRGGELELREAGFENVAPQFMNYKVDGTFRDSKLFANTYKVLPVRTNFQSIDTIEVNISGSTKLDLVVSPYIRIKDASITNVGGIVTATFSLEQTGFGNVSKIGLYAGADKNVGEPARLVKKETNINAPVSPLNPVTTYTLSINTNNEIDLKTGKFYYFRIGALYDAPNARFNYVTAVEIQL
ncbi:DUF3823 domain-containing protein [uncultured Polaribacter sp.]|uniref:DUF3823 domain-containing protein n=1 Tax=uncultured Polaribacter sp. TaxID=174711 RepID=UPI00262FD99B|nr:DUF3823 domain-containing protein [uncultured Polaribacter sp.]